MATQSDLGKVAKEALVMLEYFGNGRKGRKPQGYYVQPVPNNPPKKHEVVDSNQAVKPQGYYIQPVLNIPPKKGEVIDSNEAAKLYGGEVFVGFRPRKPARWGF